MWEDTLQRRSHVQTNKHSQKITLGFEEADFPCHAFCVFYQFIWFPYKREKVNFVVKSWHSSVWWSVWSISILLFIRHLFLVFYFWEILAALCPISCKVFLNIELKKFPHNRLNSVKDLLSSKPLNSLFLWLYPFMLTKLFWYLYWTKWIIADADFFKWL